MIGSYFEKYHIEYPEDLLMHKALADAVVNAPVADVSAQSLTEALEYFANVADAEYEDKVLEALEDIGFSQDLAYDLIAEAHCSMGALYYDGVHVEQNFELAQTHYTNGSRLGDPQSACNLGYVYLYGRTGEKDLQKAYEQFSFAASMNNVNALFKLGDLYRFGQHVSAQPAKAYKLYLRAYEMLENDAYFSPDVHKRLADCHFEGIGTEIDHWLAFEHYQKALTSGYDKLLSDDPFVSSLIEKVEEKIEVLKNEFKHRHRLTHD